VNDGTAAEFDAFDASRGFPATASASIAARSVGPATWAARLKGCSRAGRNRTPMPSASAAASAATR
jgi:hypothetical protein